MIKYRVPWNGGLFSKDELERNLSLNNKGERFDVLVSAFGDRG